MFLYLLINLLSVSVPFLVSFDKRIRLMKDWKPLILSLLIGSIPFLAWDQYFTAKSYWGFNASYLLGIYFFDLPLEEILFFFCIPFACIFTHIAILKIRVLRLGQKATNWVSFFILIGISGLLLSQQDKAYTLWVSLFTLVIHVFGHIYYKNLLKHFYITFLFMLIPFFIVNGTLTGMGIENEVVWYNNNENLAIRLFTIPVEDVIYAYAMILLNLMLFAKLSNNKDLYYKDKARSKNV